MLIGFKGRLIKSGTWYAAEVPALLVHTQAKSQKAAIEAVNNAVSELLKAAGVDGFDPENTEWTDRRAYEFMVLLPVDQSAIAFILRQLRGYKALSLSEAAKRLGASSKNAVAAYEKKGGRAPTLPKLNQFFDIYGVRAQISLSA